MSGVHSCLCTESAMGMTMQAARRSLCEAFEGSRVTCQPPHLLLSDRGTRENDSSLTLNGHASPYAMGGKTLTALMRAGLCVRPLTAQG